jgi:hypothetical protein
MSTAGRGMTISDAAPLDGATVAAPAAGQLGALLLAAAGLRRMRDGLG